MGFSDKVKAGLEQVDATAVRKAQWAERCGSEEDLIAVTLTEDQVSLLQEVIAEVPQSMWETMSYRVYRNVAGGGVSLYAPGIKYIDPDGNLRLSGHYHEYFPGSSTGAPNTIQAQASLKGKIDQLPTIGSQQVIGWRSRSLWSIREDFIPRSPHIPMQPDIMLFRDVVLFQRFGEPFPTEDFFIGWVQALVKKYEQNVQENTKQQQWASQGLCRYCGGKLNWLGHACKSCGKKN